MKLLDTPHKKKSAGLTFLVALLLLLLFFVMGLTYFDPPVSYGMEVNFGTYAQGSGEVQPEVATQPSVSTHDQTPPENEVTPPAPEKAEAKVEEVITQKESTVTVDKKQNSKPNEENITPTKAEKPEPQKISDATNNIISNLLKNKKSDAIQVEGEGDDNQPGDKGKIEGNPYASSYYNSAGLGGEGKGYGLNGRSLQSSGKVVQECNQSGVVVVRITVNNQGQVIAAEPGVKGSTNTHPCLLEPAKKTALLHKWFPDNNAPAEQIGFVVIQFKLGE